MDGYVSLESIFRVIIEIVLCIRTGLLLHDSGDEFREISPQFC